MNSMSNQQISNIHNSNPVSITPSGFYGDGPEMIGSVEDFLTEEEIQYLFDFASNNTVWDYTETRYNDEGTVIYDASYWENRVATRNTLDRSNPNIVTMVEEILNTRARKIISEFFNVEAEYTTPAIVRWFPGQFQNPHADKELHIGDDAGKPNDFPWYDLATIIYLNDDYEGGELFFPVQGIEFKPKRGGMYFFPGDKNYIHGIREIKSGVRYTCPLFWTITAHKDKIDL